MSRNDTTPWKKTACILCSLNCGLEVQLGGEAREGEAQAHLDAGDPLPEGVGVAGGDVDLVNCTLAGNEATAYGGGVGLFGGVPADRR